MRLDHLEHEPGGHGGVKALPPRSSTAIPVAEASQWVEETMPKEPTQLGSGRKHPLSITTEASRGA